MATRTHHQQEPPIATKQIRETADRLVRKLQEEHRVCTYQAAVEFEVSPRTILRALRVARDHDRIEMVYMDGDRCWYSSPVDNADWDLITVRRAYELGKLSPHVYRRLEAAFTLRTPRLNPSSPDSVLYVVAFRRLTAAEMERLKMKLMSC